MDVRTAIESRRSIKVFDPNHRVPPAEIDELFRLTLLAPTAFNIQHWRFVLVEDPALRREIRGVAWNQASVTDASFLVILCADTQAWTKKPERYWANAPEPVRNFVVPAIQQYYGGRDQVQRDEAMRSCGLAGMALMLAARSMGLDSCPMDGFDYEAVGRLIGLPADHLISFMIAVGKGTQEPWPRSGQLPLTDVVIRNSF